MNTKILLDANFLIYCAKEKIDYKADIEGLMASGYELVAPVQVVHELEKIEKNAKKYSDKQAARLALLLLRANRVKIIKVRGRTGDEAVINASKNNIVATHDSALRKKLARSIVVKGKRKIDFY